MENRIYRFINMTFLCIVLLLIENVAVAQQVNHPPNSAWLKATEGSLKAKGILYRIADSTLYLTSSLSRRDLMNGAAVLQPFEASKIKYIKLRRQGKVKSGILIGFLCGAATGAVIGYLYHGTWADITDTPAQFAMRGAVAGGLFGGALGGIIGLGKLNIPINGSQGWFDVNRGILRDRSFQKSLLK
jgi:hypothetical protein